MKNHPISALLTAWYHQNKRNLPWRNSRNPYFIWLSEVILQQTRVDQGTAYYHKFTEKYPEVADLAMASEEDVMLSWQGLGYYSRARNLHAAAKSVVSDHNGKFPKTYQDIRNLKGVGDYTAAAVASIAYGLPHAAVDGNVNRVVARLFEVEENPLLPPGKRKIQEISNLLLQTEDPGAYNQAMMELGATLCKPRNPSCDICPISQHCGAFANGRQHEFPVKGEKTKVKTRYLHFIIFTDAQNKVLVTRRAQNDIWKGLYQFPLLETDGPVEPQSLNIPGTENMTIKKIQTNIRHLLTHRELIIGFYHFEGEKLPNKHWENYEVIHLSDLNKLAFPRAITRYLESAFNTQE
jgi:A/G-specific adenine glycosylase